jgi:hypothetical protein
MTFGHVLVPAGLGLICYGVIAIRRGAINTENGTSRRIRDPFGFWLEAVGVMLLGGGFLIVGFMAW